MITATNANTPVASAGAASALPGEPGAAEAAADFLLELQAALGMPVQPDPAALTPAQPDAEGQAKAGEDSEELQNLPMPSAAVAVAPAIFATPAPEILVSDAPPLAAVPLEAAPAQAVPAQAVPVQAALPLAVSAEPAIAQVAGADDGSAPSAPALAVALASAAEEGVQAASPAASAELAKLSPSPLAKASDAAPDQPSVLDMVESPVPDSGLAAGQARASEAAASSNLSAEARPVTADAAPAAVQAFSGRATEQAIEAEQPSAESLLAAGAARAQAPAPVGTQAKEMQPLDDTSVTRKPATVVNAPDLLVSNAGGAAGGAQPLPTPASNLPVLEPSHRLPVEPHQMRLDGGPVQTEVLKLVRQGGGQIVLELTPPDQGSYRLDLRLDAQGRAHLVVDGASDSVRTRLEQGEAILREQLSQMGLDLQLNYRQQERGFAFSDAPGNGTSSGAQARGDAPALAADTVAGRPRGRAGLEGGLVHLYA